MAEHFTKTAEVPKSIGGAGQGVKIGVVLAFVLVISAGIALLARHSAAAQRSRRARKPRPASAAGCCA